MIPQLGQDIKTLLGRLGSWPCDFNQEVAVSLYSAAAQNLAPNTSAVDLTPSGGKTTVLLSAAAFRNGAKVVALLDEAAMHPMEKMWLLRAHRLFKLKDTCILAEHIENMQAAFVVVRGNEKLARSIYSEGLKADGVLFGINLEKLDGVEPEKRGNGWAVWRKSKALHAEKQERRESPTNGIDAKSVELAVVPPEDAHIISEEEAARLREA